MYTIQVGQVDGYEAAEWNVCAIQLSVVCGMLNSGCGTMRGWVWSSSGCGEVWVGMLRQLAR